MVRFGFLKPNWLLVSRTLLP